MFPLAVEIIVHRWVDAGRDAYGNPRAGYAPPEPVRVFGVVVGGLEEPTQYHPEAAEYALTVYAPVEAGLTDRDRVEYDGGVFEIDGRPGCWDANPWFSPGLVEARCKEVVG